MCSNRNILPLILAGGILVSAVLADAKKSPASKPAPGSIAAQLKLRFNLMRSAGCDPYSTLASALRNNLKGWNDLSPDQREKFRREAFAFMQRNPKEQEKLIQQYEKFISMSPDRQETYRRRADWLKVVVASFTARERKDLEQMTPADRAAKLVQRRNELAKQGKLSLSEPASRPASQPAEAPKAK